jgi:hypothetical protein
MLVNQADAYTNTSLDKYGFGTAMMVLEEGKTPYGIPRVTYRFVNYSNYSKLWPTTNDYTTYGGPIAEPVNGTNKVSRTFSTADVSIDTSGHKLDVTIKPADEQTDPGPGPSEEIYTASVVSVSVSSPDSQTSGVSALPISGNPATRAHYLVKWSMPSRTALTQRVTLSTTCAAGASAVIQAQALAAFDPTTVTWNTYPTPISFSYGTSVTSMTTGSTITFDVTSLMAEITGNDIYLALMIDANVDAALGSSATAKWNTP